MTKAYTPGSFTKNFTWEHSYERLFKAIRNGFGERLEPVSRDQWRAQSGIRDGDRQLIPLNFFLHSVRGIKEDFVLIDRLVEAAVERRYNRDFAQLALFAFHLARSGNWRGSKWPDGRVAGWAKDFILQAAGRDGNWKGSAFDEARLTAFLEQHLDAESVTLRKVYTNYHFMLESAGVLTNGVLQPPNYSQRWYVDAIQLFWDRHFFDGNLPPNGSPRTLEEVFFDQEIHKLLNCNEAQARVFVRVALREYAPALQEAHAKQLNTLRAWGQIAA
jgi:hypothetical protein